MKVATTFILASLLLAVPHLCASASLGPKKGSAKASGLRSSVSAETIGGLVELDASPMDYSSTFSGGKESHVGEDASWKSVDNWWRDPLSFFDDDGNEISKLPRRSKNPFKLPFRSGGKAKKKRRVESKRNKNEAMALSLPENDSSEDKIKLSRYLNPFIIVTQLSKVITNPLVFATATCYVVICLKYSGNFDFDVVRQKIMQVVEIKADDKAMTFEEDATTIENAAITPAAIRTTRNGLKRLGRRTEQERTKDELEVEMRELLTKAITAERQRDGVEQKCDLLNHQIQDLKKQLNQVMKVNVDLHAHLKLTRKVSEDIHRLSTKVDRLSIDVANINISGSSAGNKVYGRT